MKPWIFFHLCLICFPVIILTGCDKDDVNKYENYFEGKVDAKSFYPDWSFLVCSKFSGEYYPDSAFTLNVNDCTDRQFIKIGLKSAIQPGVYTSVDETGNQVSCSFSDYETNYTLPNGSPHSLNADKCEEVRLEITNIKYREDEDEYYIEGLLDAVVRDTAINETIIISDARFGYSF